MTGFQQKADDAFKVARDLHFPRAEMVHFQDGAIGQDEAAFRIEQRGTVRHVIQDGLHQRPFAFRRVVGCFQFAEQAGVFDGDGRLIGERRHDFDLPLGKQVGDRPGQTEHADQVAIAHQRDTEHGADAADGGPFVGTV